MANMPKRLNKSQRAAMLNIIDDYNRDELQNFDEYDVPEWFLDWPLWSAGENMPGYMPQTPYCLFLTERAARGHCYALEREAGGQNYVSDYMPVTLRELLPRSYGATG